MNKDRSSTYYFNNFVRNKKRLSGKTFNLKSVLIEKFGAKFDGLNRAFVVDSAVYQAVQKYVDDNRACERCGEFQVNGAVFSDIHQKFCNPCRVEIKK